jgi:SAM-dependent methyltransferase
MSEHRHAAEPPQNVDSWNELYLASAHMWSGKPNPQLLAEKANLASGRALDVGCGEGADAIWLAQNGWDVVATDISTVALERAAQHALDTDPEASTRIEWQQADLFVDPPAPDSFDLVSAQFMQLAPVPRTQMFSALATSVRTGGTLFVVGHHPSDLASGVPRPQMPERFYTADDIANLLDDSWTVLVKEARPRLGITREGLEATIHDAVLLAARR